MRIGLIIYGDLTRQSGGYLYDRSLVEHLRRKGHPVEIISLPWRNYLLHLTDNFSPKFRSKVRSLPLDCLLQDELNHPSLFLLNRALHRESHIPIVTIVHHLRCLEEHPGWQKEIYRVVERKYLMGLDGWVFNSAATRDSVLNLVGEVFPEHFVIAHPGGDRWQNLPTESDIQNRARQSGPLRLLFVGNLIPRKGLHILLEALSLMPRHSFHLDVIGDQMAAPRYVSRLKRLVRRFGLERQIHFWGRVEHQVLESLYKQAQIFVMPSFYEGFGIAYLEAMGFGLPVLATAQGGATEFVTHGVNGYLIKPGDVLALAEVIAELNANREKLTEMAVTARQSYLLYPTWEQSMERITNWLEIFVDQKAQNNDRRE